MITQYGKDYISRVTFTKEASADFSPENVIDAVLGFGRNIIDGGGTVTKDNVVSASEKAVQQVVGEDSVEKVQNAVKTVGKDTGLIKERNLLNNFLRRMQDPQTAMHTNITGKATSLLGAGVGGALGASAASKLTDRQRKILDVIEGTKTTLPIRRGGKIFDTTLSGLLGGLLGVYPGAALGSVVSDLQAPSEGVAALIHDSALNKNPALSHMDMGAAAGGIVGAAAAAKHNADEYSRKIRKAMETSKIRTILRAALMR